MNSGVVNQFQPSLTEWMQALGRDPALALAMRAEDGTKADRLECLYQTIGLPYERPEIFEAREVVHPSALFLEQLQQRSQELCAFRLVPKDPALPKLRERGRTFQELYEDWLPRQSFDPELYHVHVCPHSDTLLWSAIFVVRPEGIIGEITRGLHSQLTQGETYNQTYRGSFDFYRWQWSHEDEEAERQLRRMVRMIRVLDHPFRQTLTEQLQSTFVQEYLEGYFEATIWPGDQLFFIDYNRLLPTRIDWTKIAPFEPFSDAIQGIGASPGRAQGRVRLMTPERLVQDPASFRAGDILVCQNTDVRYLPLMVRAAAIVTDLGGMLSHASIISRELRKPSIVGTQTATKVLQEGDLVEVDANKGMIRKIEKLV
jgi:phosphohistidine swiveling domain-containing protein